MNEQRFTLVSEEREKAKYKTEQYLKQHLHEVNDIIKTKSKTNFIDYRTGDEIANANDNNIWFSMNILIIFTTGAIFDSNDKAFLDEVMTYFDNRNSEYLGCQAVVYSYNTDIVQKFENLYALANGNYHICMFVICYADQEDLKLAPENTFTHRGIVNCLLEQQEIKNEMIRLMLNYGFTKVNKYQPNTATHIGANDNTTLPDIKIQFDSNIEYDSATNRELFSNLKNHDSIMGSRTRINGSVDGIRSHPRKFRSKLIGNRGENTENHIHNDNYISYTFPDSKLGINNRMDERIDTRLTNETPTYEIYDKTTENLPDEPFEYTLPGISNIKQDFNLNKSQIQMPSKVFNN